MRIMAVDLGLARTGLAISDPGEQLASPVCTVEQYYQPERMATRVAEEAKKQGAACIVVGHPRNMDGSRGESARRAEEFAEYLKQAAGVPVELWDERMTTVSAIGYLNETDVRGKNACRKPRLYRNYRKDRAEYRHHQPDQPLHPVRRRWV